MSAVCFTCDPEECNCYGDAARHYASGLAAGAWATLPAPGPLGLTWSPPLDPSTTILQPSVDAGAGPHAVRHTASRSSLRFRPRSIPSPIRLSSRIVLPVRLLSSLICRIRIRSLLCRRRISCPCSPSALTWGRGWCDACHHCDYIV